MRDPGRVSEILEAVVAAVDVPVTLKIRTGWDSQQRNALEIGRIAEECGISALAIHGRTRADGYRGEAEYETIRQVREALSIPVIANGDITDPHKAQAVLEETGADGVMIGRAAQGNPWIFREINHFLKSGEILPPPAVAEVRELLLEHLDNLYRFYGEETGVRVARKHIAWYSKGRRGGARFREAVNRVESAAEQIAATATFFDQFPDQAAERAAFAA